MSSAVCTETYVVCTAFVLCKPLVCLEGQLGEAESHEGKQALRLEATVLVVDTVHPHQHVAVGHAHAFFGSWPC